MSKRRKLSTRATLDAWRKCHADRLDPVRFHFVEAMEKRASSHDGEVRRILDGRLSKLLASYADDLEKAASNNSNVGSSAGPTAPARGAFGELLDHIANPVELYNDDDAATSNAARWRNTFPDLPVLNEFRKIWSKLRVESQLRQSLKQTPGNAGPLNSGALVYRAIAMMRELSPSYLEHFLSYLDTLSWMEQMNRSAITAKDTPQAANAKKRSRNRRSQPVKR